MLGMQSVGSQSPRGTDTLLWNDIESKRRNGTNSTSTTFDLLTRRFTTFTSTTTTTTTTSHDHKGQLFNADESTRQIKLKIVKYNPMIFRMLREHLIAHACYTDVTVSHRLNQFLDVKLRIPELRCDITNHQLCYTQHYRNSNATTGSMFFAYLTGESFSPSSSNSPSSNNTPNQQISAASLSRSVSSDSSYSIASTTSSEYSQELSLPSLQSFGQPIASTQSDDMVSC